MVEDTLYAPQSLRGITKQITAGRLRCAEAVEQCLARVSKAENEVRAFLHLDGEGALCQAHVLDRQCKGALTKSPLGGVCVAVKDIIDVAGMPTTAGSNVPRHRVADRDAEIVARLRAAGAIIIGKANTHEFAYGATTPPTRNPCDRSRIAGGSSGGSAAAVASGMALVGLGSDTGGSVRLPAALCGVAALRPCAGSIGMAGIIPLAAEFDMWGVMAKTADDLALLWSTLDNQSALTDLAATRLLVPRNASDTIPDLTDIVASVFSATIACADKAGIQVLEVDIPDLREWQAPRMAIQTRLALQAHRAAGWWPDRRDYYSDEVRTNLEMAEAKENESLDKARERLSWLDSQIDNLLVDDAIVCLPTVPIAAPRLEEIAQVRRRGEARHPIIGLLACCTLPFSRPDLASLTIPCGRDAAGMPIGIQFAAAANPAVLCAGMKIETLIAGTGSDGAASLRS